MSEPFFKNLPEVHKVKCPGIFQVLEIPTPEGPQQFRRQIGSIMRFKEEEGVQGFSYMSWLATLSYGERLRRHAERTKPRKLKLVASWDPAADGNRLVGYSATYLFIDDPYKE